MVSEADRETEKRIRLNIKQNFPGDAFLGEESGSDQLNSRTGFWVVDPIDGMPRVCCRFNDRDRLHF